MKRYITATMLILTAFACTAGADDWHVDSGGSIQAAINGAIAGDTIYVHAGTYTENVDVNKTLTLRGDGAGVVTVEAFNISEHVFNVTADYVNITGFTATGAAGDTKAGIYLGNDVDHCDISENNVSNCNRGICLNHSSNNTLANNVMAGNTYNFGVLGMNPTHYVHDIDTSNLVNGKPIRYWVGQQDQQVPDDAGYVGVVNCDNITVMDMGLTGNLQAVLLAYSIDSVVRNVTASDNYCSIFLYNSTNNALTGNNVSNSDYGIYLQYSSDNSITGNIANLNTRYNINLVDSSSNNTLTDNNASGGNYCGIAIALLSNNNTLVNNTANSNGPGGVGGILLYDSCNHNNILGNTANSNHGYSGILLYRSCSHNNLTGNTANSNNGTYGGIALHSSPNDNVITGNTAIDNNPYGILMASSSGNTIYNNYFANTNNAYDDGSNVWNTTPATGPNIVGSPEIGGNYWSDYAGTDDNNDGFGDTPHPIGSSNHDYLPLVLPVCGDITGDGNIDTVDLLLLIEHVVKGTPVDACIGDIDGNGQLNSLDALLLMGYINDSTGYSLNCGC